ncbi:hypothetical protein B0T26DRAFT_714286 [Lasiosphaeria miniovina]|uniref:Uncharacterized protein n=1 Tax=Lasiosphaeria miniovina TaxID=1954250 RepID=A0AA40AAS6_9PEZI|nr:uncharacterized protein B0T26DRAFT_714286 [Lasiosphaeria miniovina]KAK0712427.1 hypothetical protein B0T26DRAFT_714286 [Lasiosphaeria miniovina]
MNILFLRRPPLWIVAAAATAEVGVAAAVAGAVYILFLRCRETFGKIRRSARPQSPLLASSCCWALVSLGSTECNVEGHFSFSKTSPDSDCGA